MRLLVKIAVFLPLLCFYSCNSENDNIDKEPVITTIDSYIELSNDKSLSRKNRLLNLKKAYDLCSSIRSYDLKIKKIVNISVEYYELKDLENYKKLNERVLQLSSEIGDSLNMARSYAYIGIYYRPIKLDVAYGNFYEADKIYSSLDKERYNRKDYAFDYGKVLIDLALILRKTKDYSRSESLTIKAIGNFILSKNTQYLPLCYSNLGSVAKYLGRYEESVEYHLKAKKKARGKDNEILHALLSCNNIGTVYKSQKKYEKAKEYYNKGLLHTEFLNENPKRYALLLDNLAYVNFLSNDMITIPDLFYKALKIRDSIDDKYGLVTNTLHLAEYYQAINKDSIAKIYAERSRDLSLELQNNGELLQAYQLLSEVSGSKEGLQYANQYIKLNDSLIKEERLFRDKFARIRFETDQKEQQIATVQHQNTIYLLGILLLVTSIGFVIYFFKQRTRYLNHQNKIGQFQASYETETRIAKRLHDELGNDIFHAMMQYQNDPHDPQIMEKLNKAYSRARDISRENNDFETGELYPEELNDMLQNYTQNGIQLIAIGFDKINWGQMSKTVKITVYRVLQELMTNMQKHSKASLVKLVFSNPKDTLVIKYSDNGIGVTEEHLKSKNGLRNTEKRIQAIRGTLIFDVDNDKGFKAEIQIPN